MNSTSHADNCVKRNSHAKLSRGSGENLESDVDYVFTVFEGKRGLMHVNKFGTVLSAPREVLEGDRAGYRKLPDSRGVTGSFKCPV
ncbi:hypothetical protein DPMN_168108 [Dreissena polymorpha]|uniref:Uncharacterized protein n=1 Tax=Dreissena polymorpha TaxID=45954 RepID=A0A9D4F5T3_DREPO|nr:hypothetical protein DPMN_168108 [Dreissena polymorpha]